MVASFQWVTVPVPHLVGAAMVFVLGNIYCWMQCALTAMCTENRMTNSSTNPDNRLPNTAVGTTKIQLAVRVLLTVMSTLGYVLMVILGKLAKKKFDGDPIKKMHWSPDMPGYYYRISAALSEWTMAVCFLMFFLTYYNQFRRIKCRVHVSTE